MHNRREKGSETHGLPSPRPLTRWTTTSTASERLHPGFRARMPWICISRTQSLNSIAASRREFGSNRASISRCIRQLVADVSFGRVDMLVSAFSFVPTVPCASVGFAPKIPSSDRSGHSDASRFRGGASAPIAANARYVAVRCQRSMRRPSKCLKFRTLSVTRMRSWTAATAAIWPSAKGGVRPAFESRARSSPCHSAATAS